MNRWGLLGLVVLLVTGCGVVLAEAAICFGGWGIITPTRPTEPYCVLSRDCQYEMGRYRREMEEYLDQLKCERQAAIEEFNNAVQRYNTSR